MWSSFNQGYGSVPAYTFFPYLAGGSGLTFEAAELPDDAEARRMGLQVLAQHDSAAEVEIWRDDQMIHRERRVGSGVAAS